jgi:hypothetical protein
MVAPHIGGCHFVDKYDNIAFAPDYNNMGIDAFEPMLYEFFKNRNRVQGGFTS